MVEVLIDDLELVDEDVPPTTECENACVNTLEGESE